MIHQDATPGKDLTQCPLPRCVKILYGLNRLAKCPNQSPRMESINATEIRHTSIRIFSVPHATPLLMRLPAIKTVIVMKQQPGLCGESLSTGWSSSVFTATAWQKLKFFRHFVDTRCLLISLSQIDIKGGKHV